MPKQIPLTQGKCAIVDDGDYEFLNQRKWHAKNNGRIWYAACNSLMKESKKRYTVRMHQLILSAPTGFEIDHINHDGLDNRRCNLRICTRSQNALHTRAHLDKITSKYKGVLFEKRRNRWRSFIVINKKYKQLGLFKSEHEAASVYNKAAITHFGDFAVLNQLPETVANYYS